MGLLPTIDLAGVKVTRLICGGNPLAGFSHFSDEMNWDMIRYYTMPRILDLWRTCRANGINTVQLRGDRHMQRAMYEFRLGGGDIQWIAMTASEVRDVPAHIRSLKPFAPAAIYHHGTQVDQAWQTGKIDQVADYVKVIKDLGLPAGVGSHIPEVIEYAEEKGWETDFYMGCFYNLARGYKTAPAEHKGTAKEEFLPGDPARMTATLRAVKKPCLGFKLLAASRNCATPADVRKSFDFAFANLKPTDAVVVGMFQKHKDQVAENAAIVRDILCPAAARA